MHCLYMECDSGYCPDSPFKYSKGLEETLALYVTITQTVLRTTVDTAPCLHSQTNNGLIFTNVFIACTISLFRLKVINLLIVLLSVSLLTLICSPSMVCSILFSV